VGYWCVFWSQCVYILKTWQLRQDLWKHPLNLRYALLTMHLIVAFLFYRRDFQHCALGYDPLKLQHSLPNFPIKTCVVVPTLHGHHRIIPWLLFVSHVIAIYRNENLHWSYYDLKLSHMLFIFDIIMALPRGDSNYFVLDFKLTLCISTTNLVPTATITCSFIFLASTTITIGLLTFALPLYCSKKTLPMDRNTTISKTLLLVPYCIIIAKVCSTCQEHICILLSHSFSWGDITFIYFHAH